VKLKTKVVALSLLTLLLPWSAWTLLQELERYLRDTQETALLGAARTIAGSMPLEFQSRLRFAPDRYVLLRPLLRPPSLDGYADDWPSPEQAQEFPVAGAASSLRLLAGSNGGRLYLLLTTAEPGITLLTRNPRGLQRYTMSPGAPGPLQLSSESGEAGQGEGFWLDTGSGHRAELSLPGGDENTDLAFLAVGGSSAAAAPGRGDWVRLMPPWERVSAWLAQAAGPASRAWLVDADGWVLADSAGTGPDFASSAAPPRTTWLQRALYRIVADSEMDPRDDWPSESIRLAGAPVDSALAGEEALGWSQDLDTAIVRNTAAVPVIQDGAIRGAIVLQSTSEGLLLVTNQALARLLFTTLALSFGLVAGLWYFASRLSRRVRRLGQAVTQAMGERAEPDALPLLHDRDELGQLARNTEKLLRAVADYSQYLQTLAGKLSHELKTPLAITRSSLDNLANQPLDAESQRFLQRAREGVERQSALVRAMSEASRLETAIGSAEWEEVDLGELVARCVAGYRTLYAGRRLELELPEAPLRLTCAPDLLAQALDKLVDNAMSMTGPQDEVAVALRRSADGCELAVRNSGTTLPEDFRERLFDSLVSLRQKRGAEPHLGLGLYIVRLVVAAHSGTVSAHNLPDSAGVEFAIRLPRTQGV